VHAHHAIVFAQLVIDGVGYGVHAVLVTIRDKDMQPLPGVSVADMGIKMGLNGVDNARLIFDNVRIPRTNLLNRSVESQSLSQHYGPLLPVHYVTCMARQPGDVPQKVWPNGDFFNLKTTAESMIEFSYGTR